MQKLFVAIMSGGDYDDKWETSLVAGSVEAEVEAFMNNHKQQRDEQVNWQLKLSEFFRDFSNANPISFVPSRKDIPRWPAGLGKHQITDEMRAERAAIEEHNNNQGQMAKDAHEQWVQTKWRPAYEDFCRLNGKPIPTEFDYNASTGRSWIDRVRYRIEELDFLG